MRTVSLLTAVDESGENRQGHSDDELVIAAGNNCLMALRLSGLKTKPAGCGKTVRAAIRQNFCYRSQFRALMLAPPGIIVYFATKS